MRPFYINLTDMLKPLWYQKCDTYNQGNALAGFLFLVNYDLLLYGD